MIWGCLCFLRADIEGNFNFYAVANFSLKPPESVFTKKFLVTLFNSRCFSPQKLSEEDV